MFTDQVEGEHHCLRGVLISNLFRLDRGNFKGVKDLLKSLNSMVRVSCRVIWFCLFLDGAQSWWEVSFACRVEIVGMLYLGELDLYLTGVFFKRGLRRLADPKRWLPIKCEWTCSLNGIWVLKDLLQSIRAFFIILSQPKYALWDWPHSKPLLYHLLKLSIAIEYLPCCICRPSSCLCSTHNRYGAWCLI